MRTRLSIDTSALTRNYQIVQNKIGPGCEAAAVIKADAYGLGMAPVAKALQSAGVETFFVASIEEAAELRGVLGTGLSIYTLNGFDGAQGPLYEAEQIIPVLNSLEDVAHFKAHGGALPAPALHIDTGMNRLGLRADEAADAIDVKPALVMSHFASADEPGHPMNETQSAAFESAAAMFPGAAKSLANSSGIFRSNAYHFDMVRPGMCLYGLNPTPEAPNPMEAVVTLSTPVLQIRTASAGETCGYNTTYRFDKETRLATVALGYADGFLRRLSNSGMLYWKDVALPIRGRVSMDLTIVDLSALPESDLPSPGDRLEVIGPHQSADELATAAGTIGYEILTSLGARYERVYSD